MSAAKKPRPKRQVAKAALGKSYRVYYSPPPPEAAVVQRPPELVPGSVGREILQGGEEAGR